MLWAGQRGWGFGVGGAKAPLPSPLPGSAGAGVQKTPRGECLLWGACTRHPPGVGKQKPGSDLPQVRFIGRSVSVLCSLCHILKNCGAHSSSASRFSLVCLSRYKEDKDLVTTYKNVALDDAVCRQDFFNTSPIKPITIILTMVEAQAPLIIV